MKKPALKFNLFLFIFFIFSFCTTNFTYAAGKGEIKPLSFVSCTLDDGSNIDDPNGITLQPKFTLLFDKNVVDMLVWNKNRNCISLSTDNNVNVAIDVSKIDDTVDFAHRQQIFVSPSNALNSDTTYHIHVSPNLIAKNGVSTLGGTTNGKGITITFKTKKQEVTQNTNTTSTTNQSDTQQNTESTPVAATNTTTANSTNAVEAPNTTGENTTKAASQNNSQENISETPKTEDNKKAEEDKNNEASSKVSEDTVISSSENETANQSEVLMGKSASNDNSAKWLYFIIGTTLIFWIVIEFIFKRRRRKRSL